MSDTGTEVTGTIGSIELHTVPSHFEGVADKTVVRIELDIERVVDNAGVPVDTSTLISQHFQGPAELIGLFERGERVRIMTTTPMGVYIATIVAAPLA
jgi:hypothetical protein